MSSDKTLLSNKFCNLVDEVAEIESSALVRKDVVSKSARRKNRRRRRKSDRQSAVKLKEDLPCRISFGDCKEGSKCDGDKRIVSPRGIRERSNIVCENGTGVSKVETKPSMRGNLSSGGLNGSIKPSQTKNIVEKRERGRNGRPEFERPVSWLADNISRWLFGDVIVDNTQLFCSYFITYNEMIKPQSKVKLME